MTEGGNVCRSATRPIIGLYEEWFDRVLDTTEVKGLFLSRCFLDKLALL